MKSYTRSINVNRSVEDVFFYVASFENIQDWDPGVVKAKKLTKGPVAMGSQYELTLKFFINEFKMIYTVTGLEKNKKIFLRGLNDSIHADAQIIFEKSSTMSTKITYTVDMKFLGFMEKLENLMEFSIKNSVEAAIQGLFNALEPRHPVNPQVDFKTKISDSILLPSLIQFSSIGYNSKRQGWKPISENLLNKTALVTGASTGLGRETALQLARLQASLILVARSEDKLKELKNEIQLEYGNKNVQIFTADLSLLAETRALAKKIKSKYKKLDILINNAGALFNNKFVTKEGNEQSLSLLLLSPVLLTHLLQPLLYKAKLARVVNVSSGGMYTSGLEIDDLQFANSEYNGKIAYARAKRGLVEISALMAKKWQADGILVNSMHPGWADTPGVENSMPGFYSFTKKILRDLKEGADSIVWLAAASEVQNLTGKFIFDRKPHLTSVLPGTQVNDEQRTDYYDRIMKLISGFLK